MGVCTIQVRGPPQFLLVLAFSADLKNALGLVSSICMCVCVGGSFGISFSFIHFDAGILIIHTSKNNVICCNLFIEVTRS